MKRFSPCVDPHQLSLVEAAIYAGAPLEAVRAAVRSGLLPSTRSASGVGPSTVHSRDVELWADTPATQAQLAMRHSRLGASA